VLTRSQIDRFLATLYEDSALKDRLVLWTFVVLVFPTAVLVGLGVPERPAYLTMSALLLPLLLVLYSWQAPQAIPKEHVERDSQERVQLAEHAEVAISAPHSRILSLHGAGHRNEIWLHSSLGYPLSANPDHLAVLERGVDVWNRWRQEHRDIRVNLKGANLGGANLIRVDLEGVLLNQADLGRADLRSACLNNSELVAANLKGANLRSSSLVRAGLRGADLSGASLTWADLRMADLSDSDLSEADLQRASLTHSIFTRARVGYTVFGDNDLSEVKGLESVSHFAPSTIGIDTIYRSKGRIPESFLRGAAVPDTFIGYIRSLTAPPIEFYSCFISYAFEDQDFADRLYADLQNKGVRCWFAPHDIMAGAKLHEQIDEAIRLHDKLLLILSPDSMESEWVKTEIAKARKREVRDNRRVLFPIRLVPFEALRDWKLFDADTGKDFAREIREYFIPDLSDWKNRGSYQEAFERLLKDLKAQDSRAGT
jgi:uncharacterized protein YjbI with pentapeptide repeats